MFQLRYPRCASLTDCECTTAGGIFSNIFPSCKGKVMITQTYGQCQQQRSLYKDNAFQPESLFFYCTEVRMGGGLLFHFPVHFFPTFLFKLDEKK